MKKIIVAGICALALGLVVPSVYVGQTVEQSQTTETVSIFRKKEKNRQEGETPQDTPTNAPAVPTRTTPAETPETNKGTSFVEVADVNRPFYRKHNYVPETGNPQNNMQQPVTLAAEIAPQAPTNQPNQTAPNTSPNNAPPITNPVNQPTSFIG